MKKNIWRSTVYCTALFVYLLSTGRSIAAPRIHYTWCTDVIHQGMEQQQDTIPPKEIITEKLKEVTVEQRKKGLQKSYFEPKNVVTVNAAELLKAACCNLSESFETNPSIDVSYSDALMGAKQIKMLGLSSPYIQFTEENIPTIRGAAQTYGLSFIPGTWVESIQITKGVGSVANGYESMAGQINTELKKPFTEPLLFVNAFASQGGRQEFNTHWNTSLNERWHTGLFVHANRRIEAMDANGDGFMDMPMGDQVNLMHRWQYTDTQKGWVGFATLKWLKDDKEAGQMDSQINFMGGQPLWKSITSTERLEGAFKMGYVFPEMPYQSIGLQGNLSRHVQQSTFGQKAYDMDHISGYANGLFQSIIGSTQNKFKAGGNLTFDQYEELLNGSEFRRRDYSIGSFFEYSYDNLDNIGLVAGVRADWHNQWGAFITPRLHLRYNPWTKTTLRLAAGSGRRAANIFTENQNIFLTNRLLVLENNAGPIYGFDPELSWNYGGSIRQTASLGSIGLDLTLDLYRTQFKDQVVVNWENPQRLSFQPLQGESYANSALASLEIDIPTHWEVRLAYKLDDVKTTYDGNLLQRPLQPRKRAFAQLSYQSTPNALGAQWRWAATYHGVGSQRLVANVRNPYGGYAPSYHLVNSQLTKAFSKTLEVYVGVENATNYTQENPIIAASEPYNDRFDAAQIYAPIFGRMGYIGMRWTLL